MSEETIRRYSNWLEIDRAAIAGNVRRMAEVTGVKVMAVIKANGYGHGLVEVARTAVAAGAAYCGVARLDEALELREAGVRAPILVLGHTPEERLGEAVAHDVSLTVYHARHVRALREALRRADRPARVHLKVDTGMSRLGAPPEEALPLMKELAGTPGVALEGLFTHFARADEPEDPTTAEQERLFREVLAEAEAVGLRPPLVHAANSAAALTRPESRFDMVRAGIALYGLAPSEQVPLPEGFRPALTWKARLTSVRDLPPGTGVSYGHVYRTRGWERIGVVPVGYGDGYRRVEGNFALVRGRRVPVVGRVCMDQVMVRLDEVPEAQVGDEVVLIGAQGEATITAEEVARIWRTVHYEVTCGLSARVRRLYHGHVEPAAEAAV